MNLDQSINHACEHLPEGWSIRIDIERGYAGVIAIRPNGTEADMHEDETELEQQVLSVLILARDEAEADKIGNSNLGAFTLLRGKLKEGQCPECAVVHKPEEPHNQESLFYKYSFREKHGRWPTWHDAIAHCSEEVRTIWIEELAKCGVVVPPPETPSHEN